MNASMKYGYISISEKAKVVVFTVQHSVLVKCNYLIHSEMSYKLCFNEYTWLNKSRKTSSQEH